MRNSSNTLDQIDRFDRIDRKLLQLLQQDGRITNADLAQQVGLSPSACLRRVQRLERDGAIEGYGAGLNAAAVGQIGRAHV